MRMVGCEVVAGQLSGSPTLLGPSTSGFRFEGSAVQTFTRTRLGAAGANLREETDFDMVELGRKWALGALAIIYFSTKPSSGVPIR